MKLKLNDDGSAVVVDGKPVYVHDDGKEIPFDTDGAVRRIANLLEEKDRHYNSAQKYKTDLEKFTGIESPEEALKALETVKNLKDKELVDAGEIERLKAQFTEMFDKERGELASAIESKDATIRQLMIGSRFAASPWFSGEKPKAILPPDIAAEHFGKHFKVEDDGGNARVVGYLNGNKILSRERVGETADFEEALSFLIENYPQRDRILAETSGGSGSNGNTGSGGSKTVSRSVFEALPPQEQSALIKEGKTVVD